jgi:hypothetical protein
MTKVRFFADNRRETLPFLCILRRDVFINRNVAMLWLFE